MGNTLAHRDYELYDPVRITAFTDRIEFVSPGALPLGVDPVAFRQGRVGPRWRNQVLAWFFNRLGLAQAEGQGIQTMLRTMGAAGCPPPIFETDQVRVACTLPANPRALELERNGAPPREFDVERRRAVHRREGHKRALLDAVTGAGVAGVGRADLARVLPDVGPVALKALLRALRSGGKIHSRGSTKAARWFAGPRRRRK